MSTGSRPAQRPRADRERNRDIIVAAARRAFVEADEKGVPVSMNGIARAAQVGVATLYRHFPTRDDLAEAVYQSKLDELTARVAERTHTQNAHTALRTWVQEFASFMLSKRGMMDTLRQGWQSGTITTSDTAARIADVIDQFLREGRDDHSIRSGVEPMDVVMGICALLSTTPPEDDHGSRAQLLLTLFVDGLSTRTT
ncbi:TetR/AcrR family transcriptional regulator [Lentzea sp. NBC_00516]|uniref:TetR/AcrR family transcriptional regulator n=1 Tax=Lentzea sp. NBC_00516 TaxID=2903582 RepID=UPI002E8195FF|nr:TetR/AcrR family transcriptional regulator [Lentzea sp. NBC_00516]WUD27358.1 TetR/AcrR family transcriptional regulator [Lentzea sp. NBC_00516]